MQTHKSALTLPLMRLLVSAVLGSASRISYLGMWRDRLRRRRERPTTTTARTTKNPKKQQQKNPTPKQNTKTTKRTGEKEKLKTKSEVVVS